MSEFARRGYDGATVRTIAREAGVDPALVYHYFGSKDGVFVESMRPQMRPPSGAELPRATPAEQAQRVMVLFLERWVGAKGPTPLLALLRSASSDPKAARLLRQLLARQVTSQISQAVPMDDVELRVALIGSTLFGVAFLRDIVRVEPLASASPEDIGRWVGPVIHRYVTAPLR